MESIGQLGEDRLVEKLIGLVPKGSGAAGPGDDCAVVDVGGGLLQLLKTDTLVEGIHYRPEEDPIRVGWKAAARVVSDFAAMGGAPNQFLVTIALANTTPVAWIENVYRGIAKCLNHYGGAVAGGETSRIPEGAAAVISIAATGKVEKGKAVLRSGGAPGDELWVTGRLGGSLAGKHLDFFPRVEEGQWLAGTEVVSAMMDVSDGLAKDLPRLARRSRCGFILDQNRVPRNPGCDLNAALNDGEDFELLFATRGQLGLAADWKSKFPDLELTKIGELVDVESSDQLRGGWDHFS